MEGFIAWCGFIGAWLLFAGPVYQAARELREQELERDRIATTSATVPKPAAISNWWWLLPPVHYARTHQRSNAYRASVMAALDAEDAAALFAYISKAIGWLLVGLGGLLLAVSETWQLTEHYHWPVVIFWLVTVGMTSLSGLYTLAGHRGAQKLLKSI